MAKQRDSVTSYRLHDNTNPQQHTTLFWFCEASILTKGVFVSSTSARIGKGWQVPQGQEMARIKQFEYEFFCLSQLHQTHTDTRSKLGALRLGEASKYRFCCEGADCSDLQADDKSLGTRESHAREPRAGSARRAKRLGRRRASWNP